MIIAAVAILGGVGLVFAVMIALANRKLKVFVDPRIDVVTGMLPGANCGACGMPGCRAFAEKLVKAESKPAGCNVASEDERSSIAGYLGVDAGNAVKTVARLMCAGGAYVSDRQADYRGHATCAAASAVAGGGKGCSWGCLGLADCVRSCNFNAMWMRDDGLPAIDIEKCTACGDCVRACPKDLLEVHPLDHRLLVQCKSLIAGDRALEACRVACTAYGKCVVDGAPDFISVATGVAVVDYGLNERAENEAVLRCPTGAIVWLDGAQFTNPASIRTSGARVAPQLIGSSL